MRSIIESRNSLAVLFFLFWSVLFTTPVLSQMPGPGYEREKAQMLARQNQHPLDRDSILLIDTSLVFDPSTYEEEVIITQAKYSLRDYCIRYLGVGDPEILMDGKPHTIVNPLTYEDMIIQYNPAGKIDILSPK